MCSAVGRLNTKYSYVTNYLRVLYSFLFLKICNCLERVQVLELLKNMELPLKSRYCLFVCFIHTPF
jgi:hypothetical protein